MSGGAQITVTIAGTAVAKGRPRVTRKGLVYTPAAMRKYEAYGRLAAQEAMVRPDTDNYVKAALDAINGIVVSDDCLVVELAAEKRYARVPQLRIVVTPLPAAAAQAKNNAPTGGGDSAASDLLERA